MERLYPPVGRNLVLNLEPLAVGPANTLRFIVQSFAGAMLARQSVSARIVKALKVCGGILALAAIHLLPGRWRRVVLWEQPNIGEFCLGTHYFLRWLDRQPQAEGERYVFITSSCHNRTLLGMVRRRVRVVENSFLYEWCRPPFNTTHAARFWAYYGPMGDFEDSPPHLSLTDSEKGEGQQLLKRMNFTADQPFACVHWRDGEFHAQAHRSEERTSTMRDTNVGTMLPSIRYLAESGLGVVRLGAAVREPLPDSFCQEFPRVIDYARLHRTDFGDVFLPACCRLFVGTSSGLFCVAQAFNRPLVLVDYNFPQYLNQKTSRTIIIFKKYWLRSEQRFLTYRELVLRFPWYIDDMALDKAGIEAVANTAEEILSAVREGLDLFVNNVDPATDEDKELQKRFLAMFPPANVLGHRFPRVGREFLRANRHLLA